ncbi:hypothetical protein [Micromonospora sp. WMMD882]|uniref:hypothetical protein n=1 Tax=Micromonospora sp. WMMD882 TaxID=3015151 RepID=UPI0032B1181D
MVLRSAVPRRHEAMRPLWLCRACGAEWPCAPARLALVARFGQDRVSLAVYLAVLMDRAYDDKAALNPAPGPDVAELYRRFLGWIRSATSRHLVLDVDRSRRNANADSTPPGTDPPDSSHEAPPHQAPFPAPPHREGA